MIIKFDATFLLHNFGACQNVIEKSIIRDFKITKDTNNLFELDEDEVVLFMMINGFFSRETLNPKFTHFDQQIKVEPTLNLTRHQCSIVFTNKYVVVVFGKEVVKIRLKDFDEVHVFNDHIRLNMGKQVYLIWLNDLTHVLQFIFNLDVLQHIDVDITKIGANIHIALETVDMKNLVS